MPLFTPNSNPDRIVQTCLCFILRGEEVLLIEKKRGLGAGLVNAPGGHLLEGESMQEAVLREVEEEVRVTPLQLQKMGKMTFSFFPSEAAALEQSLDREEQYNEVFIARDHYGTPTETEEARPFWVKRREVPYHRMWQDDVCWLPGMLAGHRFEGRFSFYQDRMISGGIVWEEREEL